MAPGVWGLGHTCLRGCFRAVAAAAVTRQVSSPLAGSASAPLALDLEKKPLMPKEETAGRGVGAWLCGGDITRTEEEDDAGTMG